MSVLMVKGRRCCLLMLSTFYPLLSLVLSLTLYLYISTYLSLRLRQTDVCLNLSRSLSLSLPPLSFSYCPCLSSLYLNKSCTCMYTGIFAEHTHTPTCLHILVSTHGHTHIYSLWYTCTHTNIFVMILHLLSVMT